MENFTTTNLAFASLIIVSTRSKAVQHALGLAEQSIMSKLPQTSRGKLILKYTMLLLLLTAVWYDIPNAIYQSEACKVGALTITAAMGLLTFRLVGATDKDMIVASRVTAIILIVVSIILEIVR